MNNHRTAEALLATLVVMGLGACSDDAASSASEPSTSPSAASSEPSSPEPSATGDEPAYKVLGPSTQEDLEPGRWAVTAMGSRVVPLAVADVPESSAGIHGGGGYLWTLGGAPENDGWVLGYSTAYRVHVHPCTRAGGMFVGSEESPDLFVEALEAQRGTTTSRAVPVQIDGHDGIYVKLTTPAAHDYDDCKGNGLAIFDSTTKGDHHLIDTPGQVERYWVVDVGGERVLLWAQTSPETTDAQLEQLTDLVESVQFKRS